MLYKYWNKETYNESGTFYRKEDWGIELAERPGDNFTDKEPLGLDQQVIPKQHFDNDANEWVLDVDCVERGTFDSVRVLSKLAILEAMDNLPDERAKFDTLMQDSKFNERWHAATELNLNHPLTIQALEQVDFDIDALKREILNLTEDA